MNIMEKYLPGVLSCRFRLQRTIAKTLLENQLSSIIRTAAGHKANKLPKGSSAYLILWQQADEKVASFCEKHNVERSKIESQIPALKELQGLSVPAQPASKWLYLTLLAVPVVIVAIGYLVGVIHALFTFGYNLEPFLRRIL